MYTADVIFLKCIIVFLAIVVLILLRVWADCELVITWCYREFHKDARLPERFPKPSRYRKILFFLFLLKNKAYDNSGSKAKHRQTL